MLENNTTAFAQKLKQEIDQKREESATSDFAQQLAQTDGQKPRWKKMHKIILGVSLVLLLLTSIFAVLGWYTYTAALEIKAQTATLRQQGTEAYAFFKDQNLPATQEKVDAAAETLATITGLYDKLFFYKYIPIANSYYQDGINGLAAAKAGSVAGQKSLAAIAPYADVLGFGGEEKFQGGTTEDRLKIILETLDKVAPILDEIAAELQIVETNLRAIDPNRYPENIDSIPVRELIVTGQNLSSAAVSALTEYRPIIEELPSIAGAKGERKKYLILFQNDNELRPTGGFLTAYAIINVENGKVEAEKSDDIYELDKKFTKKLPIPAELGRYLTTEKYWNLRDMNISPDFKLSMDQFFTNYQTVKGEPETLDGIIAVDTHFLTNLIKVLGPIEVPGYGTFSAENEPKCDCPQIIYVLSEIITKPTPYIREYRKGIIGPLMRSLLTKAYTAPKDTWPALFETGFMSVQNKHAQFYFLDEKAQKAVELADLAGTMTPPNENQDFLGIINANLGGAKSNLFIDYSVKQEIAAPVNGMIEKTVEITYRNRRKADNCNLEAGLLCLNSTLRDWTRLYVPQGSQLISAQGFLEDARTYEENGFTVIDGFFKLEPLGSSKLTLKYSVPYQDSTTYRTALWKQAGIETFESLMDVTGGQEMVVVAKNTLYETPF